MKKAFFAVVLLLASQTSAAAGLIGNSLDCVFSDTIQYCQKGVCRKSGPSKGSLKYYIGKEGNLYDYTGSSSGDIFPNGKWVRLKGGVSAKANWTDTSLVMASKVKELTQTWKMTAAGNRVSSTMNIVFSEPGYTMKLHSMQCKLLSGNAFR